MSDLTREQIEERRRWIEATTVNPEYATVLCDMALRTLDAEKRNPQLEAALREIRYRCVTRAANSNGQLIREVDRVLSSTAPPGSDRDRESLAEGDTLAAFGMGHLSVAKKNRKSVVTDGGSKWTRFELTGCK